MPLPVVEEPHEGLASASDDEESFRVPESLADASAPPELLPEDDDEPESEASTDASAPPEPLPEEDPELLPDEPELPDDEPELLPDDVPSPPESVVSLPPPLEVPEQAGIANTKSPAPVPHARRTESVQRLVLLFIRRSPLRRPFDAHCPTRGQLYHNLGPRAPPSSGIR